MNDINYKDLCWKLVDKMNDAQRKKPAKVDIIAHLSSTMRNSVAATKVAK